MPIDLGLPDTVVTVRFGLALNSHRLAETFAECAAEAVKSGYLDSCRDDYRAMVVGGEEVGFLELYVGHAFKGGGTEGHHFVLCRDYLGKHPLPIWAPSIKLTDPAELPKSKLVSELVFTQDTPEELYLVSNHNTDVQARVEICEGLAKFVAEWLRLYKQSLSEM